MSQGKFHIDKNGNPALCSAEVRECPRGGFHGNAEEIAREAVRRHLESEDDGYSAAPAKEARWGPGEIQVGRLNGEVRHASNIAVVPPGRYFLGDPCYTAGTDHETWGRWVEVAAETGNDFQDGVVGATYNGEPVLGASTKYGDGTYVGSNGESYSVDAGMIGVVPESVIRSMGLTEEQLNGSGTWVEVREPSHLEVDEDGTIYFGGVSIETGDRKCENCGQPCADDDYLCDDCRWEDEESEYEEEDEYEDF